MSDSVHGVRDFQRRVRRDTAKSVSAKVTGLLGPTYFNADIYEDADTSSGGTVLGNFIVRDNEGLVRAVDDTVQVSQDPAGQWFVKPESSAVFIGRVFAKLTAAEEIDEGFVGTDIGRMYRVDLFKSGPNANGDFNVVDATSRVAVRQLQQKRRAGLDPHDPNQPNAPAGTMAIVFKAGGRYFMQIAVFLG